MNCYVLETTVTLNSGGHRGGALLHIQPPTNRKCKAGHVFKETGMRKRKKTQLECCLFPFPLPSVRIWGTNAYSSNLVKNYAGRRRVVIWCACTWFSNETLNIRWKRMCGEEMTHKVYCSLEHQITSWALLTEHKTPCFCVGIVSFYLFSATSHISPI